MHMLTLPRANLRLCFDRMCSLQPNFKICKTYTGWQKTQKQVFRWMTFRMDCNCEISVLLFYYWILSLCMFCALWVSKIVLVRVHVLCTSKFKMYILCPSAGLAQFYFGIVMPFPSSSVTTGLRNVVFFLCCFFIFCRGHMHFSCQGFAILIIELTLFRTRSWCQNMLSFDLRIYLQSYWPVCVISPAQELESAQWGQP